MTTGRIHVGGFSVPATFLVRILNLLRNSPSETLRRRFAAWRGSDLSQLGLSLDGRVQLADLAARRVDQDLLLVAGEFQSRKDLLEGCIPGSRAFRFTQQSLESELLLDLHTFLFELRCALELLEKFLLSFFEIVLATKQTKKDLRRRLKHRGVDDSWIRRLSALRDLLAHNATPPLAFEIKSTHPLEFELLLLREFPASNADFPGETRLSELRSFFRGYKDSLGVVEQWLTAEIEGFERQAGRPSPEDEK